LGITFRVPPKIITNHVTVWWRASIHKLVVLELVKKFATIYATHPQVVPILSQINPYPF
jgi:hypothetical protein